MSKTVDVCVSFVCISTNVVQLIILSWPASAFISPLIFLLSFSYTSLAFTYVKVYQRRSCHYYSEVSWKSLSCQE